MGRGIAKQIKLEFPAAFDADKATARGDVRKLGTCTSAGVFGRSGPLVIVNAYTQFKWSGPHQVADYQAIAACMAWIKANHSGKRIGLPKIGAGLAGGDWAVIRGHIGEGLKGEDVTVVEYQQG